MHLVFLTLCLYRDQMLAPVWSCTWMPYLHLVFQRLADAKLCQCHAVVQVSWNRLHLCRCSSSLLFWKLLEEENQHKNLMFNSNWIFNLVSLMAQKILQAGPVEVQHMQHVLMDMELCWRTFKLIPPFSVGFLALLDFYSFNYKINSLWARPSVLLHNILMFDSNMAKSEKTNTRVFCCALLPLSCQSPLRVPLPTQDLELFSNYLCMTDARRIYCSLWGPQRKHKHVN